ncbi:MAG: hypothetical protein ABIZ72_07625 [Candidatus Limnocylindrales bacterium]
MDRTNPGERAFAAPPAADSEAIDFVRFCHRRRRVGWPELYDEMCAVAGRGLYRGYRADELSTIGIGLGLFQMPGLAALVARVVAEDVDRRRRSAEAIRASLAAGDSELVTVVVGGSADCVDETAHLARRTDPDPADAGGPDHGSMRFAVGAGA